MVVDNIKNSVERITTIPEDVENISVYPREPRDDAVDVLFTGDVSLKELKVAAEKFETRLLEQEGISKIAITGYPNEELEISLIPEKMIMAKEKPSPLQNANKTEVIKE